MNTTILLSSTKQCSTTPIPWSRAANPAVRVLPLPLPPRWWLTVDYQIACSADGWSPMLLPCAVLTILIPVGIPVGMLVVLMRLKAELKTSHSHARDKYGFFVGEYNVRHFYWECLELLRKMVLVGFICFLERGSAIQLVLGTLWTLASGLRH